MHATTEQLLDIRDGNESSMTEHVQTCEHCQSELAYLDKLAQQLFDAHDQSPSDHHWQRILQSSGLQQATDNEALERAKLAGSGADETVVPLVMQNNSLSRAIYTLAASVMFVGLVSVFMISQQNSVQQQNNQMQASINQLMMNSQGLENVLQQVVVRDERLSAEDKAAAERLYWKLTYVDQELHSINPEEPNDAERIKILWSDRVEVLNELNRLFYQRRDAMVNSEH